jgi:hypothetical protein
MGKLVEFARQALVEEASKVVAPEEAGPLVAVKIVGSIVGDFWLCLSDEEPFDPGDGLPVYRPAEMKLLLEKGSTPEHLQAVHRLKRTFDGKIVS